MTVRPTTEDLLAMGDFQRTNMWKVSMIRKPVGLSINTEGFNLRCRTSSIPGYEQTAIETYVRSNRVYDSNVVYNNGELTLGFLEYVSADIRRMIFEWEDLCRLRADTLRNITADIRLVQMDNQENDVVEYIMGWCFLEKANMGELAGTEQGAQLMTPEIVFKYNTLARNILA
jgi:hypothetical protein